MAISLLLILVFPLKFPDSLKITSYPAKLVCCFALEIDSKPKVSPTTVAADINDMPGILSKYTIRLLTSLF